MGRGACGVAHIQLYASFVGRRYSLWTGIALAQGASKGASPPIQVGGGHTRGGGGHAKAAARSSGEGVVSL